MGDGQQALRKAQLADEKGGMIRIRVTERPVADESSGEGRGRGGVDGGPGLCVVWGASGGMLQCGDHDSYPCHDRSALPASTSLHLGMGRGWGLCQASQPAMSPASRKCASMFLPDEPFAIRIRFSLTSFDSPLYTPLGNIGRGSLTDPSSGAIAGRPHPR